VKWYYEKFYINAAVFYQASHKYKYW
jgi:hypothetical protein